MKISTIASLMLFFSLSSYALEVPKDFDSHDDNFWIHPKSLETVSRSNEDVSHEDVSLDPMKDISQVMEAKAATMKHIMSVSDWKIKEKFEKKAGGIHHLWFFGSYIDSDKKVAKFAEVYRLPASGKPESYVFIRPDKDYSEKELAERFKVGVK